MNDGGVFLLNRTLMVSAVARRFQPGMGRGMKRRGAGHRFTPRMGKPTLGIVSANRKVMKKAVAPSARYHGGNRNIISPHCILVVPMCSLSCDAIQIGCLNDQLSHMS